MENNEQNYNFHMVSQKDGFRSSGDKTDYKELKLWIEENKIDNKQIEKYINEFLSLEKPTRELIINLVEKIYIYQDKRVDIIFTFKNVT